MKTDDYERKGFALNTETSKYCPCCEQVKERAEYSKNKARRDGIGSICKVCEKMKRQERLKKPEFKKKHNEQSAKWRRENPERLKEINTSFRERNRDRINEKARSEEGRRYNREYVRKRRKEDPVFKVRCAVSRQVHHALVGKHKATSTFNALPYTPEQLKEHLENQFEDWMTWDNYGMGEGCWNIDHIYPQSLLPYDSMEHPNFLKCWDLSNLRPLGAIENTKKGNNVID